MSDRIGQSCDHGDMQARYAHQVVYARAREGLPLSRRDGALIAHHERRNDSGIRTICKRFEDPSAQALPHAFDPVLRLVDHRCQALGRAARPYVARGAYTALEHPCLVVESVRVRSPVRTFEPHVESPALTCFHFRQSNAEIVRRATPPRNGDALGHVRSSGQRVFDVELEAHAALVRLWQTRDDANDLDVASLPFGRQRISET
jgi:hypothetical protein